MFGERNLHRVVTDAVIYRLGIVTDGVTVSQLLQSNILVSDVVTPPVVIMSVSRNILRHVAQQTTQRGQVTGPPIPANLPLSIPTLPPPLNLKSI